MRIRKNGPLIDPTLIAPGPLFGGKSGTLGRRQIAFIALTRQLRDAVYDFIMRIRYRIFGRLDNVCPVTPPELRARFDD